jgi:hypothetical protein
MAPTMAKQKRETEVSPPSAEKLRGGRPEGGENVAARDLGLKWDTVKRAQEYAARYEVTGN